jgi:hypothetical protein
VLRKIKGKREYGEKRDERRLRAAEGRKKRCAGDLVINIYYMRRRGCFLAPNRASPPFFNEKSGKNKDGTVKVAENLTVKAILARKSKIFGFRCDFAQKKLDVGRRAT